MRRFGFPVRGEIRWGRYYSHSKLRPDADGNHILGHLFAETDTRIEALRYDVRQTRLRAEFDVDFRIIDEKPVDHRPEDRLCRMLRGRNADCSGRSVAKFVQVLQLPLNPLKSRTDSVEQPLSCFSRRDASCCAGEQPDPEPLLQSPNGVTEGRLRRSQPSRRPGEAFFLCDGQESREIAQLLASYS